MQTLTWARETPTQSRCTDVVGYRLLATLTVTGRGWRFDIDQHADNCAHCAYWSGYPTERAAQLACEAFLWRNGVLPLPEWYIDGSGKDSLKVGSWRALVIGCNWQVWRRGATGAEDTSASTAPLETFYAAQAAAERHLRCEIAAAMDAEAAREEK